MKLELNQIIIDFDNIGKISWSFIKNGEHRKCSKDDLKTISSVLEKVKEKVDFSRMGMGLNW